MWDIWALVCQCFVVALVSVIITPSNRRCLSTLLMLLGFWSLWTRSLPRGELSGNTGTSTKGTHTNACEYSDVHVPWNPAIIPPPLCMLALGKTGEGAYSQDSDIYMWRPLPTDECHVGVRSLHFLSLFDGQNSRKVTKYVIIWYK